MEDQLLAQWRRCCADGDGGRAQPVSVPPVAIAAGVLRAVLDALDGSGVESPHLEQAAREWAQVPTPVADIVAQLGCLRDLLAPGPPGERSAPTGTPAPRGTATGSHRRARLQQIVDRVTIVATETAIASAEHAALTDALTHVGNRRAMVEAGRPAVAAARRAGYPLSVLTIDLDGLKVLNDTAGHSAGDAALADLARTVSQALRRSDQLFRVGGDEFVAIMPLVGTADVTEILHRAEAAGAPRFSWGRADLGVDGDSLEELLAAADRHLYAGRQQRRSGQLPVTGGPTAVAGVVGVARPNPPRLAAGATDAGASPETEAPAPPISTPGARPRTALWALTLVLVLVFLAIALVIVTLTRFAR